MRRYNKVIYPGLVNVAMVVIAVIFGEEVAANPEVATMVAAGVNLLAIYRAPANKEAD